MVNAEKSSYHDKSKSPRERARLLLSEMTLDEKLYQITSEMHFDVTGDYEQRRDPMCGSYRNPGHFLHDCLGRTASPGEVAEAINRDVKSSIAAQPHSVPPIENGEALHGAQWGMGTCFPQPIGMASSFDPELVKDIAVAVGKECSAVGVRQVFAPVVNVVRDCRWGRTVETYGEDVLLSSDMGAAYCEGLERGGVIATPKHFVDNYSEGGRDSNYSQNSERTLREVFLPPFKACFDAGAQSVMAAYNAWDGTPCTCNEFLLSQVLRGEWGFGGFAVSDYSGVDGLCSAHDLYEDSAAAAANAIKAGLEVILPYASVDVLKEAVDKGLLDERDVDRAAERILTAKFRLGLFEDPYADGSYADRIVRCPEHKALALKAAFESIVLLKNEGGLLPLNKKKIKRIGVFGDGADRLPVGDNYSGPYKVGWSAQDAKTPAEYLKEYLSDGVEIVRADPELAAVIAKDLDAVIYLTSMIEGEGSDRSDLRLPGIRRSAGDADDAGLIVDRSEHVVREDQERIIAGLCEANRNTVVILLSGAPVDMSAWIDKAQAVVEAWYPGEQGSEALTRILFGEVSPSGKLPLSFPKRAGQLPLYYSHKPSGRGYAYCDDDGRPLFEFGFGLSYTSFELKASFSEMRSNSARYSVALSNVGSYDSDEVVQLYIRGRLCSVVRPVKELKRYKRVSVKAGETISFSMELTPEDFMYYDSRMDFGLHDGTYDVYIGSSSEILSRVNVLTVAGGIISEKR